MKISHLLSTGGALNTSHSLLLDIFVSRSFSEISFAWFVPFDRHRIPLDNWWLKLRPLLRILAKHESVYEVTSVVAVAKEVDIGDKFTA